MTLPPIETTPLLLLRFFPRASTRLIDLVVERLEEGGKLIVLTRHLSEHHQTIVHLTTSQATLERMAEQIHLMKMTADTNTIEYFTVAQRHRFIEVFQTKTNKDVHGIFTAHEWVLLVRRILDSITVLPPNEREVSS